MPRKTKRPQGTPDTPDVATGQAYGVAAEQREALAAQPLPTDGAPVAPSGASGPMPAGLGPADPMQPAPAPSLEEMALAAAGNMPPPDPNLLTVPTARPGEPWQSGLASGPGNGPDALPMNQGARRRPVTPVASTLTKLAAAYGGDPDLQALADDAARRGR